MASGHGGAFVPAPAQGTARGPRSWALSAWGFVLIALGVALLCGCAAHRHLPPVPAEIADPMALDGLAGIRTSGAAPDPVFMDRLTAALRTPLPGEDRVFALSMSGGGPKVAFSVGALTGLSASDLRPAYSVVAAVSAAALIAPFALLGPDYDADMRAIYLDQRTDTIMRHRTMLEWIGTDAFADPAPLRALIRTTMTPAVVDALAQAHRRGRVLLVNTVNLDTQDDVLWDLAALAASDHPDRADLIRSVMLAAMSFPGAFPPVYIPVTANGQRYAEMHLDGGLSRSVLAESLVRALKRADGDALPARPARLDLLVNTGLVPLREPVSPRLVTLSHRSIATLLKFKSALTLAHLSAMARNAPMRIRLLAMPTDVSIDLDDPWRPAMMRRLYRLGRQLGPRPDAWEWLR